MPRKMARSAPSTTVRAARGTGSRLRLASVLQERRKSANIHARSGVFRGIPVYFQCLWMGGARWPKGASAVPPQAPAATQEKRRRGADFARLTLLRGMSTVRSGAQGALARRARRPLRLRSGAPHPQGEQGSVMLGFQAAIRTTATRTSMLHCSIRRRGRLGPRGSTA